MILFYGVVKPLFCTTVNVKRIYSAIMEAYALMCQTYLPTMIMLFQMVVANIV